MSLILTKKNYLHSGEVFYVILHKSNLSYTLLYIYIYAHMTYCNY